MFNPQAAVLPPSLWPSVTALYLQHLPSIVMVEGMYTILYERSENNTNSYRPMCKSFLSSQQLHKTFLISLLHLCPFVF